MRVGWESTEQSKWERLAAVVDSGAHENVSLAGVCSHMKLSATRRSEAGIGFLGAGGERIRNHGSFFGKLETCSSSISGSGKTKPAESRVFTGRPQSRSLRSHMKDRP